VGSLSSVAQRAHRGSIENSGGLRAGSVLGRSGLVIMRVWLLTTACRGRFLHDRGREGHDDLTRQRSVRRSRGGSTQDTESLCRIAIFTSDITACEQLATELLRSFDIPTSWRESNVRHGATNGVSDHSRSTNQQMEAQR